MIAEGTIPLPMFRLPEVLAEMRALVASLNDAPASPHAKEMLAIGLALRELGAPRAEAARILNGVEKNHRISPADSAVREAIARAYRDRA